jgi:argininosuccinate lyase
LPSPIKPDHSVFPAPVYAETLLSVVFRDAQKYFLDELLDIHYAHTLMLARQGIIPVDAAQKCIGALGKLDREKLASIPYDGVSEDLFFFIEKDLEALAGVENSGRMHTARSRNDIALTLYRMRVRTEIVRAIQCVTAVRNVFLELAREHALTLMPAYTHTQPAQPITFAHYLLAAIELLGRDEVRLEAAFETVNRCPLGACAISTTGFPIDRYYTASLLGFEGLQLNSYGAIAATDYLTETCGVLATLMVGLGRVAQDFLLWSTAEFGFFRLSNAWVQISSIMPQKRNPVPFEHVRILASKSFTQAQGVLTCLHNTPFGDINDAEDGLQPLVFNAFEDGVRALRIMSGAMAECQVNVERMSERAHADFLSVTELADTLVRGEGISFHDAHGIVSQAVKDLDGHYSDTGMVDAAIAVGTKKLGRPFRTSRADLIKALDPMNFIQIRTIPGGPAPELTKQALLDAEKSIVETETWTASKIALAASYRTETRKASEALLAR